MTSLTNRTENEMPNEELFTSADISNTLAFLEQVAPAPEHVDILYHLKVKYRRVKADMIMNTEDETQKGVQLEQEDPGNGEGETG